MRDLFHGLALGEVEAQAKLGTLDIEEDKLKPPKLNPILYPNSFSSSLGAVID